MAHEQNKPLPPFSLRLTVDERRWLEQAAAGMPLGTFIKERLLGSTLTPRRSRRPYRDADHKALAQVLAALGGSRLASNLNQIAKAVHMGALPVTPELEDDLQRACLQIREMRDRLLHALGVGQGGDPSPSAQELRREP